MQSQQIQLPWRLARHSGGVTTLKPCRIDLMRRDPCLMKGDPTIGADRVLAQTRPGAGGAVEDDEDLAALRRHLYPKPGRPTVPIDYVFRRGRERVNHALGQLDARHLAGPSWVPGPLPRTRIGSFTRETTGSYVTLHPRSRKQYQRFVHLQE